MLLFALYKSSGGCWFHRQLSANEDLLPSFYVVHYFLNKVQTLRRDGWIVFAIER